MTLAPADFPFQSVLVESPADVDQQSGRTGVDGAAEDQVAHALGHVDAKPQDHTHQQAFGNRSQNKNEMRKNGDSTSFY